MGLSFKDSLENSRLLNTDEVFTPDDTGRYLYYNEYHDENYSIVDESKNIVLDKSQLTVMQEENSQYIPFEIPRYPEGIDLKNMIFQIYFVNKNEESDYSIPINVSYSDTKVRFGWLLNASVTAIAGTVKFMIIAEGENEHGDAYRWSTKPNAEFNVLESLKANEIVKPDDNWYSEFTKIIMNHVTTAHNYANEAKEYSEAALLSSNNAHSYSDAAQISANAAEQSKQDAISAKNDAEIAKNDASKSKTDAQASATNSLNYSNESKRYMEEALGAANLPEHIENVKAYVGYDEDYNVYGVEVDMTAGTFTRIGNAVGKNAGADFDNIRPFKRRRCNLSDNGTVNAYYGDPGYKEDGSNGQVMVEQPSFYFRVEPLILDGTKIRKARYYVSGAPREGYKLHPAFIYNGRQVDRVYMSAFEGSLYDTSAGNYIRDDAQVADFNVDKLSSIAGVKPISGTSQNLTRANARNLAHNRGSGWEQAYAATVSVSQLLMLIEYATFNMQSAIGNGSVSKADDGSSNLAEYTGASASLGNASGAVINTNGVQIVSYRGEENLWGNIWTCVDGMNEENPATFTTGDCGTLYVADHGFVDDSKASPYKNTGIHPDYGSGYVSAFGYSEGFDWLFIPVEYNGNPTLPVGDYFRNGSPDWRVVVLGGSWYQSVDAGAFCLSLYSASYTRGRSIGGRLTYIPKTTSTNSRKPIQDQVGDLSNLKTNNKNSVVDAINDTVCKTQEIENLKNFVGYSTDFDIYGLEVDYRTNTFTRLENAIGKEPGTDFTNCGPFRRRRCNVSDDGKVTAYYGDSNYKEDGSNGQVMVEQPAFYFKVEPLVLDGANIRKARYYVTGAPHEGFKLHPAFIQNGEQKDAIYLSAYEACLYDTSSKNYILDDNQVADFATDKLSSIAGAKPASGQTQALTRSNARKLAHNRGTGWEQGLIQAASVSQILMLIEYASFNVQEKIGMGNVLKTDDGTSNMAENTGGTSTLGNTSGAILNDNGVQAISYRGEENFWGDILTWIDGLNSKVDAAVETDIIYIADHEFADDTENTPYQEVGITPSMQSGYISAFGYSEEYDWLFIPSEVLGSSTLPVGDRFYQTSSSGWRVARLGGGWYYGSDSGAFCLTLNDAAYGYHRAIGTRLTYIPQTTSTKCRKPLQDQIGDTSKLQTSVKTDIVSAINTTTTTLQNNIDSAKYESINLAIKMICPTNEIILDNAGLPSVMVYVPQFKISDVIDGGSNEIHPAFIVNGNEIPGFYISKYQNVVRNGKAYSLPREDPAVSLNFDTVIRYCESKGNGWHLTTNAEWAAIALWCRKNGYMPKGNNNYGKDASETTYKAIPSSKDGERTGRVLSGTGPLTWSHDGTLAGIWDMNGNVFEWVGGYRTNEGEIQIIPNNDAADHVNQSATSTLWKAIKTDGSLVAPGIAGSLKWDYTADPGTVNTGKAFRLATTIQYKQTVEAPYSAQTFQSMTAASGVTAPEILKALAIFPADAEDYGGDYIYMRNIGERMAFRGGNWYYGGASGIFDFFGLSPRSGVGVYIGFRSAYIPDI